MALVETEAVVLRSYPLAEADRIIVFFTRKHGLVRGVARGARRLKSRFGGSLEPFTTLNLSYSEKEGRELVSIRAADIVHSLFSLSRDEAVLKSLSHVSNLLLKFAPPHEPNELLYRMVVATSRGFGLEAISTEALERYFEVWLLKLSGFLPDIKRCGRCGERPSGTGTHAFDADFRVICSNCSNGAGLNIAPATFNLLLSSLAAAPEDFGPVFTGSPAFARREMAAITGRLLSRVLGDENSAQPGRAFHYGQ